MNQNEEAALVRKAMSGSLNQTISVPKDWQKHTQPRQTQTQKSAKGTGGTPFNMNKNGGMNDSHADALASMMTELVTGAFESQKPGKGTHKPLVMMTPGAALMSGPAEVFKSNDQFVIHDGNLLFQVENGDEKEGDDLKIGGNELADDPKEESKGPEESDKKKDKKKKKRKKKSKKDKVQDEDQDVKEEGKNQGKNEDVQAVNSAKQGMPMTGMPITQPTQPMSIPQMKQEIKNLGNIEKSIDDLMEKVNLNSDVNSDFLMQMIGETPEMKKQERKIREGHEKKNLENVEKSNAEEGNLENERNLENHIVAALGGPIVEPELKELIIEVLEGPKSNDQQEAQQMIKLGDEGDISKIKSNNHEKEKSADHKKDDDLSLKQNPEDQVQLSETQLEGSGAQGQESQAHQLQVLGLKSTLKQIWMGLDKKEEAGEMIIEQNVIKQSSNLVTNQTPKEEQKGECEQIPISPDEHDAHGQITVQVRGDLSVLPPLDVSTINDKFKPTTNANSKLSLKSASAQTAPKHCLCNTTSDCREKTTEKTTEKLNTEKTTKTTENSNSNTNLNFSSNAYEAAAQLLYVFNLGQQVVTELKRLQIEYTPLSYQELRTLLVRETQRQQKTHRHNIPVERQTFQSKGTLRGKNLKPFNIRLVLEETWEKEREINSSCLTALKIKFLWELMALFQEKKVLQKLAIEAAGGEVEKVEANAGKQAVTENNAGKKAAKKGETSTQSQGVPAVAVATQHANSNSAVTVPDPSNDAAYKFEDRLQQLFVNPPLQNPFSDNLVEMLANFDYTPIQWDRRSGNLAKDLFGEKEV